MITPEARAHIRRLFFAEHWRIGTIASELGVHHETVAAAVEAERFANTRTRLSRSQLDLFKPFLEETLDAHPRLRATRLFEMIRLRGYAGGIGILRAFVRTRRRDARAEAFVRRNVLPGEEGQVDWGSFGTLRVGHATRPLMCFVMVLSASRAVFAHFFLDARMESFLEGHVRALEAFGGTPRKILYDNLKSAVLERVGDHVRFHPRLLELAGHYHFLPQPCAPYRGNEKGRVERTIRYLRDSFFAARRFRDVDDLNAQLAAWIEQVADTRAVPGDPARIPVREAREHERAVLVPLPAHPFPTEAVVAARSGKTPYLRFDRNDYSIPHALVRKALTLCASRTTVRVLDGDAEVARHARSYDAGQRVECDAHLDALVAEKRHAHALRGRDRLRGSVPSAERFFEALAERGQALARPAVRLGQLLDAHGAAALDAAIAEALRRNAISAESVAYLLQERARGEGVAARVEVPLPDDPRVRARVEPHGLAAYDALATREGGDDTEGRDE